MISRLFVISFTYLYGANMFQTPAIVTVNVNESIVYVNVSSVIEVAVNVREGYHIQANKVSDESLMPTTLEVNNTEFITINKIEFPPSKKFKLEGTDNFLEVYDEKFLIKLFHTPGAKTGNYILRAKLKYQACDSKSCLFPRVINFSIPVEIEPKK
ncbi:MAG: hypothetical protein HYR67_03165 [Bacteroidetes bacterium]|nr:hypothetical protein [Bacteroidota bacterium]